MRAIILSSLLVLTAPPDAAEAVDAEAAPEVPFPSAEPEGDPSAEPEGEPSVGPDDATGPDDDGTAESAPTEPEPVEAPAPEGPVHRSQPEVPTYTAIPSYEEPAPPTPGSQAGTDRPPPNGRGRQVVGGILVGGGLTLFGVSSAMIAIDEDIAVWIPGLVLATAATIGGAAALVGGKKRRLRYESWVADSGGDVPPGGIGLVAGGITCATAGTIGMFIGGFSLLLQGEGDLPYGQVMLPLGAVSLVTGIGLVAGGAVRKKRFDRWDRARTPTPTIGLLPGPGRDLGGATVGLRGRF